MSNQTRETHNRLDEKSFNYNLHELFCRDIHIKTNHINYVKY